MPLFVLGHDYGPLASLDIALFAVLTGWLTWRTGGLEAAIAYHVVWNCTGMPLGSIGLVDTAATETTWAGIATSVAANAIVAVLIVRAADRAGLDRTAPTRPVPRREDRTCS